MFAAVDAGGTVDEAAVRREIGGRFRAYNAAHPTSSRRVVRFLVLDEPPSFAADETTDKGSLNRYLAIRVRTFLVERLYADPPWPGVIVL